MQRIGYESFLGSSIGDLSVGESAAPSRSTSRASRMTLGSRPSSPVLGSDYRGLPHVRNNPYLRSLASSPLPTSSKIENTKIDTTKPPRAWSAGSDPSKSSLKFKSQIIQFESMIQDIQITSRDVPNGHYCERIFELFRLICNSPGPMQFILNQLMDLVQTCVYSMEEYTSSDEPGNISRVPFFEKCKLLEKEKKEIEEQKARSADHNSMSARIDKLVEKADYDMEFEKLKATVADQEIVIQRQRKTETNLNMTVTNLQKLIKSINDENEQNARNRRIAEGTDIQEYKKEITKLQLELAAQRDKADRVVEELKTSIDDLELQKRKIRDMVSRERYEEERNKATHFQRQLLEIELNNEKGGMKTADLIKRYEEATAEIARLHEERNLLTPRPQFSPRSADYIHGTLGDEADLRLSNVVETQKIAIESLKERLSMYIRQYGLMRDDLALDIDKDPDSDDGEDRGDPHTPATVPRTDVYIVGLGHGSRVPRYLQFTGRIRNKYLTKQQTETIIRDVLQQKEALERKTPGNITLTDFLYSFLKKKYGNQAAVAEWGYNICHACEKYSSEINCRLFSKSLKGEVPDNIYGDQMKILDQLYLMCSKADKKSEARKMEGRIRKNKLFRFITKMFPAKTDEDIEFLRAALTYQQPGPMVDYKHLFKDEVYMNNSLFIKLLREQHLTEVEEYLTELEEAIRDAVEENGGILNPRIFRDVVKRVDPKKPEDQILDMVAFGTNCLISDIQNVASISIVVDPFITRLRRNVWMRSSKKD